MKNLTLVVLFLGTSTGFASGSWKSASEYFENQYFRSLYGNVSEQTSQTALMSAFIIYQAQANKGDGDAMLRLAAMYEQAGPSKSDKARHWYQKAASKGSEYALRRFKMLEGKRTRHSVLSQEATACEVLTEGFSRSHGESLSHVESLAVLGQGDCMLALGNWYRTPYWFHRTLFTTASKVIQGAAAYELALLDKKSVAWLMEVAARAGNQQAMEWFEGHGTLTKGTIPRSRKA